MHWVLVVAGVALGPVQTVVAVVMHLVDTPCNLARRSRSLLAREANAKHQQRPQHLRLLPNDEMQALEAELRAKARPHTAQVLARAGDARQFEMPTEKKLRQQAPEVAVATTVTVLVVPVEEPQV
jgi:hypothetical protein